MLSLTWNSNTDAFGWQPTQHTILKCQYFMSLVWDEKKKLLSSEIGTLKEQFHQKFKFIHYLLNDMQMETLVKFHSPQNISSRKTVLQRLQVAVDSKNIKWLHTAHLRIIQVSGSPKIPNWFEET